MARIGSWPAGAGGFTGDLSSASRPSCWEEGLSHVSSPLHNCSTGKNWCSFASKPVPNAEQRVLFHCGIHVIVLQKVGVGRGQEGSPAPHHLYVIHSVRVWSKGSIG